MAVVAVGIVAAVAGGAFASIVASAVVDTTAPTGSVTLAAGGSGAIQISFTVTGRQENSATIHVYTTWTLSSGTFTGSDPTTVAVAARPVASAAADVYTVNGTVQVASGEADGGPYTLSVSPYQIDTTAPATLAAGAAGSYQVTVLNPAPSDTEAPQNVSININDFATWTNDASGDVEVDLAGTDNVGVVSYKLATSEAGLASATAIPITSTTDFSLNDRAFTLSSGEGLNKEAWLEVCDALNNCTAASDTISWDKTAPTITDLGATTSPNGNGWYKANVTNKFAASDTLSGLSSGCIANFPLVTDTTDASYGKYVESKTTSGEGGAVTVNSDSCTDVAGNSASALTSASFQIDKTAPTVSLVDGPADGASYYFGSVPAAPTCSASDGLSGLDGSCSTSGYSTAVGSHTVTATAKDQAGNVATDSHSYTVLAWTLSGFYQPVDMSPSSILWNTVKNGSTVPLKFNVFAGATELTDTADVKPLTYKAVSCSSDPADAIETTATGGTNLRYDATAGQFVYNWQTPKTSGACLMVTMTTQDGSALSAYFKLK